MKYLLNKLSILSLCLILCLLLFQNPVYAETYNNTINSKADFSHSERVKISRVVQYASTTQNPPETKISTNPRLLNIDKESVENSGVGELLEYNEPIITIETIKIASMLIFSISLAIFITIKLSKYWRKRNEK